jgi:hypothetical protein
MSDETGETVSDTDTGTTFYPELPSEVVRVIADRGGIFTAIDEANRILQQGNSVITNHMLMNMPVPEGVNRIMEETMEALNMARQQYVMLLRLRQRR